jgi:Glycosyl hydrolases family 16
VTTVSRAGSCWCRVWTGLDAWTERLSPEGATGGAVHGFVHAIGRPERNALIVELTVSLTDWHEYVIEWTPGRVDLLLDGRVVGTSDQSPVVPMRWTLQVGTTGGRPDPVVAGHLQIDRVAVWSLA